MDNPKKIFKLLIADDDEDELEICQQHAELFSLDSEYIIELKKCKTVNEAISEIKSTAFFDGFIVDINFDNHKHEKNTDGLKIIKLIEKKQLRIPTVIISGDPSGIENFPHINIFRKADNEAMYDSLFAYFLKIHKTGLTEIMSFRGKIENSLSLVFSECIMPQFTCASIDDGIWPFAKSNCDDVEYDNEKALLRIILQHLQFYLDKNNTLDSKNSTDLYEKVLPEEVYIFSSFSNPEKICEFRLVPGTIIRDTSLKNTYLILNPACDLARGKCSQILLVEIENTVSVLKSKINIEGSVSNSKIGKINDFMRNKNQNLHWLPKTKYFYGGFINFHKITIVNSDDVKNKYSNIFSTQERLSLNYCVQITDSFLKNIVSRFSSYYARQGQPEILTGNLAEILFNDCLKGTGDSHDD